MFSVEPEKLMQPIIKDPVFGTFVVHAGCMHEKVGAVLLCACTLHLRDYVLHLNQNALRLEVLLAANLCVLYNGHCGHCVRDPTP